jgi:hypothetical protein
MWFCDLAVSHIVVHTLAQPGMATPSPSVDLDEIREQHDTAEQAARA